MLPQYWNSAYQSLWSTVVIVITYGWSIKWQKNWQTRLRRKIIPYSTNLLFGFNMASIGWSLRLVRLTISTSSAWPSIKLHSNSCVSLSIAICEIVIVSRALAHTLFPRQRSLSSTIPCGVRNFIHGVLLDEGCITWKKWTMTEWICALCNIFFLRQCAM